MWETDPNTNTSIWSIFPIVGLLEQTKGGGKENKMERSE
jgi:hypothetical protein